MVVGSSPSSVLRLFVRFCQPRSLDPQMVLEKYAQRPALGNQMYDSTCAVLVSEPQPVGKPPQRCVRSQLRCVLSDDVCGKELWERVDTIPVGEWWARKGDFR